MKLDSVKIKNFRSYVNEIVVPFNDLTAFIGKNDIGKSTILEALEIFFNNSFNNAVVVCEREDVSINSTSSNIEITCVFSELPERIIIDATYETTLEQEHLLNSEEKLEIKKVFSATTAKPKEKVYIVCVHPTIENANNLLLLNHTELRQQVTTLGINMATVNQNINAEIRQAIWNYFDDLQLQEIPLLVDTNDAKKVYECIKKYLPIYALFQSDRESKDEDKEVTDPMKIAIKQALAELEVEVENIKDQVREKALATANKTLEKLQEMSPDLANTLVPEFKTEPKFDSQFKLTIKSDNNIPINKRGSGVRRLILLNFFRAEAERRMQESRNDSIIFAFEEPETSQHPDFQGILLESFISIAECSNSQVILTTHTPALAGMLPQDSLRFIEKDNSGLRSIALGNDETFEKICGTLGVLPDPISKNTKALLLVEGKSDVKFIKHTAEKLKEAGLLNHSFEDKNFAILPIGGCGNLKHWITLKLAEQFGIPWCILLDSDKGTPEANKNSTAVQNLKNDGIKAYITRKREPENYIDYECLRLPDTTVTYSDIDDAKVIINQATSVKKDNVLDTFWRRMSAEQIRRAETYVDNGSEHYEFTEMFNDFLTLVD